MSVPIFQGCATHVGAKPQVVVQFLSTSEDFQRAIELQCPDIEIKWYLSSMVHSNLYENLEQLPDILVRSSYYINDVHTSYLRDISDKCDISRYSRNIIDNFVGPGGEVYWLPVYGVGYCLVANQELFRKYGIDLPTDFESLKQADREFKKHGIDGVAWGLGGEWSYERMLMAQILCADLFNSYPGLTWRREYKEALEDGSDSTILDTIVWPQVFSRFREAIDCGLIDEYDMRTGSVSATRPYLDGKAAMCLTSTDNTFMFDGDNAAIPSFDMEGSSWMAIYMKLMCAVSSQVSDERLPQVMKVFDAINSTAALTAYNESRGGAVPLNNDPSSLPPEMDRLRGTIRNGFSFLLFNEHGGGLIDGISQAFGAMYFDGLGPQEGYEVCAARTLAGRTRNKELGLNDNDPSNVVLTTAADYPIITDKDHLSPANSSLVNTTLESVNSLSERKFDILVLEGNTAGAPILPGNYYFDREGRISYGSNLIYLFNNRRFIYPAHMTVGELIRRINTQFYHFNRIDDGLPVMAGASYAVEKHDAGIPVDKLPFTPYPVNAGRVANVEKFPVRYVCTGIFKDGVPLPEDQEVDVLTGRACAFYMTEYLTGGTGDFAGFEEKLAMKSSRNTILYTPLDFVLDWILRGNDFLEPSRYVEIKSVD